MAATKIEIGTLERRAIYTSSAVKTGKITGLDADITYRLNPEGEVVLRQGRDLLETVQVGLKIVSIKERQNE